MEHDGKISLATGLSVKSLSWKNKTLKWSTFAKKLSKAVKTSETFKEYLKASKAERGKIKDVGGYVGAYLRNGRRGQKNVVSKQLLTLDLDFAHLGFWDDFILQFSSAAVLHSTHSHSDKKPRYRLVMPLSREVSPDEYVAVSRKVAELLDIELFDDTTFEPERLMFWASVSSDMDYHYYSQDGAWLDVDETLGLYKDWTDTSLWAVSSRQKEIIKSDSDKQKDPELKKGIVGAFCRAYDIHGAIAEFLGDEYTETQDGRYTYAKGSTAAGLVVYDSKFAFSHHGTDPCSGKLCNSFDLVRLHKFGHLDEGSRAQEANRKSFKEMEELARADKVVKGILAEENIRTAKYDFAEDYEELEEDSLEWATELEVDAKGKYLSTAVNLNLIFCNDSRLSGVFKLNEFDSRRYIFKSVPWRKIKKPEPVKNVDYSGVRNYIESVYKIVGNLKIDDAMALEFERQRFNPVLDYLEGLEWDGTPRAETMLIDYLGAADNPYTREAMTKTLLGAVARIYKPGTKFDLVLTLVGEQGTGKSTLARKLGRAWFSDTFSTVKGKESFEQLQGAWIIEMAELAGLRKAEVETVKHFITKQDDIFRPAFGRVVEIYKRQCVFIATTNTHGFLNDPSGNRRFNPVDIDKSQATKDIWTIPDEEINQIWAEAVELYKGGANLYMDSAAQKLARIEQKKHSKHDEREGIVEEYLNTLTPKDWKHLDLYDRIEFLQDELQRGEFERDFVCTLEIWCECLGRNRADIDKYKSREIHELMRGLADEWERSSSTKNFGFYGKQKYYSRKLD